MFYSVYIKGNHVKWCKKNVVYFIAAYITKWRLTVLTRNGGGDHKRRLSREEYIVQYTVYNARWKTMHCKPCYKAKHFIQLGGIYSHKHQIHRELLYSRFIFQTRKICRFGGVWGFVNDCILCLLPWISHLPTFSQIGARFGISVLNVLW